MKTKLILIAIAVTLGSAGIWFLISKEETAHDNRAKFFGSAKEYPTSGGEKMKVEW